MVVTMDLNSMIFTTLLSSLENRNSYNSNYLTGGKDILNQPGQDVETPSLSTSQPATEKPKPQQGVDTVTLTTAKSSLQNTLFTRDSTHLKNINVLGRLSTAAIKRKANDVLNYTDTPQNASTLFKKAAAVYQQIQGKIPDRKGEILYGLGVCLQRLDRTQEAVPVYLEALINLPDDSPLSKEIKDSLAQIKKSGK